LRLGTLAVGAAATLPLLAGPPGGGTVAATVARPPVVVVDPGHDRLPNTATEPIGPGSRQRKIKDGGGSRGAVTGTPEAVVTLQISLRLRALLRRAGTRVIMTRTRTAGSSMGNVARAQIANRAGAALFLRVHADGSTNSRDRGTHTLHPSYREGWTDDIYRESRRAARLVQAELVRTLGSRDRGLDERSDITGFNWSDVPAVLPEVGFLTNPVEDRLLASPRYQQRVAVGLCRGTMRFVGRSPGSCSASR
jgi:N-acetylmuramoyl-L-alanine amidase